VQIALSAFFEYLESASLSSAIRQSSWLYPFIEILHLLGIVLVAGGASLFDFRILSGRYNYLSPENLSLLAWSKRGLLLAIPSGILLFITNAVALSGDPVMWSKLILLGAAGLNAWIFHVRLRRPYKTGIEPGRRKAVVHAVFSLLLWTCIIACGRLLAY
jgi:hypothetical protein